MSNSFNISSAVEIAALDAKVVLVDAVVDAIRATDIPALDAKLVIVDTVVDAIHLTDVFDIQTNINVNESKIDTLNTNVGSIISTYLPGIITEVDANETKIDTIDGIVDAIKTKTDAMPQNVRGKWYTAQLSTQSGTFVELLNVSGHGRLDLLTVKCVNAGDTLEYIVTLDGVPFDTMSHGTVDTNFNASPTCVHASGVTKKIVDYLDAGDNDYRFNLEFESSLVITLRRSAGANDDVCAKVYYTLDSF